MQKQLIIDGYNAISKIRALEIKKDISLEASRMYFIKVLLDFMSQNRMFNKIFLVFDSKEKALGVRKESYGGIEVLFSAHDKDADAMIVDILRNAPGSDRMSVSSDDNFVRNHARVYGSDIIPVKELEDLIMLKKKTKKSKIKEKDLEHHKIKGINEELKKHWRLD